VGRREASSGARHQLPRLFTAGSLSAPAAPLLYRYRYPTGDDRLVRRKNVGCYR
jgi:hypothetical protein